MRLLSILAVAAIGLAHNAGAESAGRRTCRIVFPERPNDAPKSAYIFDGKKSRQVTLPSMNFSEVIELPPGELTILMTSAEITDPENLPPGAPKLKVPESIGDFYILVSPDPTNSEVPVRLNRVDTGGGKFKPGQTLWFNLTGHRIVAKLGQSRMSVEPNGRMVSESPVEKSSYYSAEFAYQPDGIGEFQRITEQQWWHDNESRHIGFMVNTGGKLPKIYFYRDFRSKDAEEVRREPE
ncbi:hypothetical protein HZ994_01765 [Akkermansiaceae bacterium]|nr:hypothetical protein HZ994_01765 [Akkermansiaceae bacterium]